jgi:hypothetical protein
MGCSSEDTSSEGGDSMTSGDGSSGDGGPATSGDGSGSAEGSEGDSADGSSDDGGGPPTLEQCIEETSIDLVCDDDARWQYVSFGEVLSCGGTVSFMSEETVALTYMPAETVDGVIQVRGLQVSDNDGARMILTAPVPVALTDLPAQIDGWTGDLLSSPAGFYEVIGAEASVTFDAVPSMEDLDAGATVSGTFVLTGGDVTNIGSPVDDPGHEVHGCFSAPGGALPQ